MSEAQTLPDLEPLARELYEQSRKRVSGRPKWEHLNQADPYDMGMRATAFARAKEQYAKERFNSMIDAALASPTKE